MKLLLVAGFVALIFCGYGMSISADAEVCVKAPWLYTGGGC